MVPVRFAGSSTAQPFASAPAAAVTPGAVHTFSGWFPVALQIAAVNTFAEPSIAWASWLEGSLSASAICWWVLPASSWGLYVAPAETYCRRCR